MIRAELVCFAADNSAAAICQTPDNPCELCSTAARQVITMFLANLPKDQAATAEQLYAAMNTRTAIECPPGKAH